MDLKTRKPNRLKGFDYSSDGLYFITVCAKNRSNIFSKITVGRDDLIPPQTELLNTGEILDKYIHSVNTKYENVEITDYVIMPNHFHLIIKINNGTVEAPCPTVSTVIKGIKGLTTREIGFSVFQNSFYDHIIRDEEDYLTKARYISENPAKWQKDKYYKR